MAEAVLRLGLFLPDDNGYWRRTIIEEGTTVTGQVIGEVLELTLLPSITVWEHHLQKRLAAGVYFEVAARVAEKCNAEIIQKSNIVGCRVGDGDLVLGRYPSVPFTFSRVCLGFQEAIMGELGAAG